MPRVLVVTEDHRQVLVDELATLDRMEGDKSADHLIERLLWGIADAERAETAFKDAVSPKDYREVAAS